MKPSSPSLSPVYFVPHAVISCPCWAGCWTERPQMLHTEVMMLPFLSVSSVTARAQLLGFPCKLQIVHTRQCLGELISEGLSVEYPNCPFPDLCFPSSPHILTKSRYTCTISSFSYVREREKKRQRERKTDLA